MSNPKIGLSGFQLIELLIVLAITAILTAVSIPVYSHLVYACRKIEAKHALAGLALAIEQYALSHHSYREISFQALKIDPEIASHHYRMVIEWGEGDRYTLFAVPEGDQTDGVLSLDSFGVSG